MPVLAGFARQPGLNDLVIKDTPKRAPNKSVLFDNLAEMAGAFIRDCILLVEHIEILDRRKAIT